MRPLPSNISLPFLLTAVGLSIIPPLYAFPPDSLKLASQNPSPMVEYTRKHVRVPNDTLVGLRFSVGGLFAKPVEVFIPKKSTPARHLDLLIHFHGASYVAEYAALKSSHPLIVATLSVGSGSKVYNDAFEDTSRFLALLDSITASVGSHLSHPIRLRRVILSGFSAGYGAIRRIISTRTNYDRVNAVLLLDGIHTSYVPERKVLYDGGQIDSLGLDAFITLAEDASKKSSKKKFLITHSEIFPGTFVSTTEATDYILHALSIPRQATLKWGPLGMQQLSLARRNHLAVYGFAGNTAPDHVDHLHGLFWFLNELMKL